MIVRPRPAELPPKATLRFDKLPPLAALPEPTELRDRKVPDEALKHYLAGASLVQDYLDADAVPEFEAALEADPAGFEPRLALGRAALRAGDLPKAQAALEVAVKQRPRSADVHYLLGVVAAGREQFPTALEQLRYSLALAEDDGQRVRIYFHLAQVLERLEHCVAAVEIAERFESMAGRVGDLPLERQWRDLVASQGWRIPALRGECLRRLGKPERAVRAYDAAMRMSPDNTDLMLALCEALIDQGDNRRASEVADRVLSREPQNTNALAMLAATMIIDNRQDQLRERLLSLVRENPSDVTLAQRVAAVFLKFDRLDAALQALAVPRGTVSEPGPIYAAMMQIVLAHDDFSPAVEGLAGLLRQMEPAERRQLIEPLAVLPVSPGLVRAAAAKGPAVLAGLGRDEAKLLAFGVIAGAAGQPVMAEQALRSALEAQPDSSLTAELLAEQLLAQCRWQDAIALAEPLAAKFKDAEAGPMHRVLGAAYDGLDDYKKAMTHLYEALRRDRRDTGAMWLAAQINDRLGQSEPASSIYQVLVTIRPGEWEAHVALVKDLLVLRQKEAAGQHVKRMKEAFPNEPVAGLCQLMVQAGATPPSAGVGALLERHPDDLLLLRAMGESLLAEGDADGATETLLEALRLEPADEDARLLLTTSLARQLHQDLAMQVLDSLLAEHPNRILWRFAKAELLAQVDQPEAGAQILLDLLKTPWGQEQRHTLQTRIVFLLEYAGRHEQAKAFLEQQLQESPQDRAIQTLLIGVLQERGKHTEALELVRTWRAAAPEDALLRRLELELLTEMATDGAATAQQAAAARAAAATEVLKDWPAGKGPSGKTLGPKEAGRLAAHDQDLALLAAAAAPGTTIAWLDSRSWLGPPSTVAASLAELVADRGDYRQAIELDRLGMLGADAIARQAQWSFLAGDRVQGELVLLPQVMAKDAEMHNRLARLLATFYKRIGLEGLSARQTETVFEQHRGTSRAGEYANDLAYIYAEGGRNLALAEKLARMAVAGDPNSAAYMDTLAWVCYQQGRFEQALPWMERAVRVPGLGDDPVLLDHLGDVYWRVGRQKEAAASWREAAAQYAEQLKTDKFRTDLEEGLEAVTAKIKAVESRKPPPVARWAGQRNRT